MIAAPFLADLYTWVLNERDTEDPSSEGVDSYTLTLYMICRTMILAGFIFHLNNRGVNKMGWVIYYVIICATFLTSAVIYYVNS